MNAFSRLRKQGSTVVLSIPKPLRSELGLLPGDLVLLAVARGALSLQKVDPAELLRAPPEKPVLLEADDDE